MVLWRRSKQLNWRAAVFAAAFCAILPGAARAEGLFDFLFHPFQDRQPQAVPSYAEPGMPIAPPPLGMENVRQGAGGGGGRAVAYCVRLCDGQHFPLDRMANATPVETCRAMCPASKTKVFFGSEIGGSVARDGARYAGLDTAFLYRKQLVAGCTCNGRDALGLAPFDLTNDATLRPGDIVATKDGLMAYGGKSASGPAYTPVDRASVADQLNSVTVRVQVSRKDAAKSVAANAAKAEPAPDDDDPGTIAPPSVNVGANTRGQLDR